MSHLYRLGCVPQDRRTVVIEQNEVEGDGEVNESNVDA